MSMQLDHIIVPARDKQVSAQFLADILGLAPEPGWGPFRPLRVSNSVTLEFMTTGDFRQHHCAFLVDEAEFDDIFARIQDGGVAYYADPGRGQCGEINTRYGGRGVYFDDPDGHLMEVLTRPYPATPAN